MILKALTAVFIVRKIGIDGFPAHRESFMWILILSEYSQREKFRRHSKTYFCKKIWSDPARHQNHSTVCPFWKSFFLDQFHNLWFIILGSLFMECESKTFLVRNIFSIGTEVKIIENCLKYFLEYFLWNQKIRLRNNRNQFLFPKVSSRFLTNVQGCYTFCMRFILSDA